MQTADTTLGLELGERVQLGDAPAAPDGVLRLPLGALLRLLAGRLQSAPATSVEVTGDVTLDDLRQVFPGF